MVFVWLMTVFVLLMMFFCVADDGVCVVADDGVCVVAVDDGVCCC